MRTIGPRIPANAPKGDFPSRCDYCGTPFWRSELSRDGAGKLRCSQEGDGRDAVTLGRTQAARAANWGRKPEAADGPFNKEDPFGPTIHLTDTIDPT